MKKETNVSFEQIFASCVSPAQNIELPEVRFAVMKEMGISILSNGKKQINPNIFSDYLKKRFILVYCEPDCFIWSKQGLYVKFTENWLKKSVLLF